MKRYLNHLLIVISIFLCEFVFAQKEELSDFYMLQRLYENRLENDTTALPIVNKLIRKAKAENNLPQLLQGYNDGRFFSPISSMKLKYADSAIRVATSLGNDKLLSQAYLSKGIIYYFNLKKYKLALNEYLKAFEKNNKEGDAYYSNKINYHIGVVKSYIGYYDLALLEFKKSRRFFEGELKKDIHPNLMFGNQRGYYNTLHQMAVCYRNLRNFPIADSLIALGLASTCKNPDFRQEYSYFLKEEGVGKYRRGDYKSAAKVLQLSLPGLISISDFGWLSVVYCHLGKSKWRCGDVEEAIKDFEKVDSIFVKHSFILPEVRVVYEDLISYYGKKNNSAKTLYYTRQLIKVDKILEQDFIYLSKKIHREYDSKRLLELERWISIKGWIYITMAFICILIGFYTFLRIRSEKEVRGKNRFLGITLGGGTSNSMPEGTFRVRNYVRKDIGDEIVVDILNKLDDFERNQEYLERKVTLASLSEKFGVNKNYLSEIIHEHKGSSFHLYLSGLRISYITNKLVKEKIYLNFKSEALAKECGIESRPNFSKLFLEINGISLAEFVKRRKNELKNKDQ